MKNEGPVVALVGAHAAVPCLDGTERPYRDLDCAASTPAMEVVADRVAQFMPWYSSVHRGAGYKSRRATAEYEGARDSAYRFARRLAAPDDVVVLVRNTTEAINHLASRLRLGPDDVVATTVVEIRPPAFDQSIGEHHKAPTLEPVLLVLVVAALDPEQGARRHRQLDRPARADLHGRGVPGR